MRDFCALIIIGLVAATGATARAQSVKDSWRPDLKRLVGVVNAQLPSGTKVEGTAFAIGYLDADLFLITARHVVVSDYGRRAISIDVNLQICPGAIPAILKDADVDADLDLAIIRVRVPLECQKELGANAIPRLGIDVVTDANEGRVGHSLILFVRGIDGGIQTIEGAKLASWSKEFFTITSTEIVEGMSGGAVATKDGKLLGLLTNRNQATRVDFVVNWLRARNIRMNLFGPYAVLEVRGHPIEARLSIDNGPSEPVRASRYVDPGSHAINLTAVGYQSAPEVTLDFKASEHRVVYAHMAAPISATWAFIRVPLLVTSLTLVAAAITTGVIAIRANKEFDKKPSRDLYDETRRLNLVADVLGGAGIAGGIVFGLGHWFWNATDRSALKDDVN
jgi:hypothetical protein